MIHHLSVGTNDPHKARAFYVPVLAVLGLRVVPGSKNGLDFGSGTFLFSVETPVDGNPASAGNGVHIAFAAENRAMVDEFYRTAMAHGGASDGEPGLRPVYDDHYYGAFVRDPNGNKIEAVTFSAK